MKKLRKGLVAEVFFFLYSSRTCRDQKTSSKMVIFDWTWSSAGSSYEKRKSTSPRRSLTCLPVCFRTREEDSVESDCCVKYGEAPTVVRRVRWTLTFSACEENWERHPVGFEPFGDWVIAWMCTTDLPSSEFRVPFAKTNPEPSTRNLQPGIRNLFGQSTFLKNGLVSLS